MNEIFLKKFPILNSDWTEWETSLKDLFSKNEKTLLYFYPKDNTPWCTLENKAFNFLKPEFNALWIKLVWISRDNIESHKKFVKNLSLENDLISDPTLELHKFFGAYGEKNNYWKIVEWVIRSTFLLDKEGNIIKSWINVKATNHAEKVLNELK
jgi:peroxiredoxin Q/BCP